MNPFQTAFKEVRCNGTLELKSGVLGRRKHVFVELFGQRMVIYDRRKQTVLREIYMDPDFTVLSNVVGHRHGESVFGFGIIISPNPDAAGPTGSVPPDAGTPQPSPLDGQRHARASAGGSAPQPTTTAAVPSASAIEATDSPLSASSLFGRRKVGRRETASPGQGHTKHASEATAKNTVSANRTGSPRSPPRRSGVNLLRGPGQGTSSPPARGHPPPRGLVRHQSASALGRSDTGSELRHAAQNARWEQEQQQIRQRKRVSILQRTGQELGSAVAATVREAQRPITYVFFAETMVQWKKWKQSLMFAMAEAMQRKAAEAAAAADTPTPPVDVGIASPEPRFSTNPPRDAFCESNPNALGVSLGSPSGTGAQAMISPGSGPGLGLGQTPTVAEGAHETAEERLRHSPGSSRHAHKQQRSGSFHTSPSSRHSIDGDGSDRTRSASTGTLGGPSVGTVTLEMELKPLGPAAASAPPHKRTGRNHDNDSDTAPETSTDDDAGALGHQATVHAQHLSATALAAAALHDVNNDGDGRDIKRRSFLVLDTMSFADDDSTGHNNGTAQRNASGVTSASPLQRQLHGKKQAREQHHSNSRSRSSSSSSSSSGSGGGGGTGAPLATRAGNIRVTGVADARGSEAASGADIPLHAPSLQTAVSDGSGSQGSGHLARASDSSNHNGSRCSVQQHGRTNNSGGSGSPSSARGSAEGGVDNAELFDHRQSLRITIRRKGTMRPKSRRGNRAPTERRPGNMTRRGTGHLDLRSSASSQFATETEKRSISARYTPPGVRGAPQFNEATTPDDPDAAAAAASVATAAAQASPSSVGGAESGSERGSSQAKRRFRAQQVRSMQREEIHRRRSRSQSDGDPTRPQPRPPPPPPAGAGGGVDAVCTDDTTGRPLTWGSKGGQTTAQFISPAQVNALLSNQTEGPASKAGGNSLPEHYLMATAESFWAYLQSASRKSGLRRVLPTTSSATLTFRGDGFIQWCQDQGYASSAERSLNLTRSMLDAQLIVRTGGDPQGGSAAHLSIDTAKATQYRFAHSVHALLKPTASTTRTRSISSGGIAPTTNSSSLTSDADPPTSSRPGSAGRSTYGGKADTSWGRRPRSSSKQTTDAVQDPAANGAPAAVDTGLSSSGSGGSDPEPGMTSTPSSARKAAGGALSRLRRNFLGKSKLASPSAASAASVGDDFLGGVVRGAGGDDDLVSGSQPGQVASTSRDGGRTGMTRFGRRGTGTQTSGGNVDTSSIIRSPPGHAVDDFAPAAAVSPASATGNRQDGNIVRLPTLANVTPSSGIKFNLAAFAEPDNIAERNESATGGSPSLQSGRTPERREQRGDKDSREENDGYGESNAGSDDDHDNIDNDSENEEDDGEEGQETVLEELVVEVLHGPQTLMDIDRRSNASASAAPSPRGSEWDSRSTTSAQSAEDRRLQLQQSLQKFSALLLVGDEDGNAFDVGESDEEEDEDDEDEEEQNEDSNAVNQADERGERRPRRPSYAEVARRGSGGSVEEQATSSPPRTASEAPTASPPQGHSPPTGFRRPRKRSQDNGERIGVSHTLPAPQKVASPRRGTLHGSDGTIAKPVDPTARPRPPGRPTNMTLRDRRRLGRRNKRVSTMRHRRSNTLGAVPFASTRVEIQFEGLDIAAIR